MPAKAVTGIALLALAAMLAGALVSFYLLEQKKALSERATVFETPRPVPEFCLLSSNSDAFCRDRLLGNWTLLFFGFTRCPDICPLTLAKLAQMLLALQENSEAAMPQVVLVSVDPTRDSPEDLKTYVHFFHRDFVGLTGQQGDIQTLTRALGVAYRYAPTDVEGEYTVEHTAALFLIGPDATLRALLRPPHRVAALANDVAILVTAQ